MKEFIDKAQKSTKAKKVAFSIRADKDLKLRIEKKLASLKKTTEGKFTLQWFTESALEAFLKQLDHL